MNKVITVILSVIIFIFTFISCDDEKDENTKREVYPCVYIKDKVEYFPVALYSSKEVSSDQAKIETFRESLKSEYDKYNNDGDLQAITPWYWGDFVFDDMIEYCNNEIIAQQVSIDSIEIIHPDFIFSGRENYWGELIYEKGILSAVKEKNGITYWESKDTTLITFLHILNYDYSYNIFIMSPDSERRFLLRSKFDSLAPIYYVESQSPDIMGLNFFSQYKYCLYLAKNKESIYIPYMNVLYKKQGKIITYRLNNIPLSDNQIISQIAEGDTLVLQQSRLYLSKYSKTN